MSSAPSSPPPGPHFSPDRVCLIKPSALGDIVQTLPVLTLLRQLWPQAQLSWVVNRSLAGVLQGHPHLDQIIELDRSGNWMTQVRKWRALVERLKRQRFDLVIDFQGLLRSGAMTWLTRAPVRIGFANAREGARWCYTHRVHIPSLMMPALEKYRLLAAAVGAVGEVPPAVFGLTAAHRHFVQRRLGHLPRPWMVVHPGAQWETKRWPVAHFLEIARRAQQRHAASIVLVGGPGEGALCRPLAEQLPGPVVDVSEQTSLLELAAVCQQANLFLSGDSGPMHLAAAVGTPVVSIFTCTSPVRAGPRGQESRIVATQVACAASYLKRCPKMICMDELLPDRVWPQVDRVLSEVQPARLRSTG